METKNYFLLRKCSLRYKYCCFVDTKEYLADSLFIKHNVKVWFEREYSKEGCDFIFIFCKVRKKDLNGFLEALEELKGKAILLGHPDYQSFCEEFSKSV